MGDFVNQHSDKINNQTHKQLSIFASVEETKNYLTKDFSLYAIESYAKDLENIIDQWLTC